MLPKFRPWARKPRNPALFAVDTKAPVRINPWESYLKGWFISSSALLPDEISLGIIVEGSFVQAVYGLPRPDVALHLNDQNLTNCGFYIRFRNPKRDRRIKLVTKGKSRQIVLAEVDVPAAEPLAQVETYEDWLIHREVSLFWAADEVGNRLSALLYRPLISVILPTFNPDRLLLEQCVQSVLGQQYANWELCISDDCSSGSHEYLTPLAADKRISITTARQRFGIAGARNRAVSKAEGDFIVLLNQRDELHPCALLEVVKRLNQHDGCALLYSDEDQMDSNGSRSNPAFKPNFDLDMLLGFNYIGRLMAMKRSSVLDLGSFRSEHEGADDWDMLIRLLEKEGSAAVQHIAKPLYHRRAHAENREPDARTDKILSDHVARSGKRAAVEPGICAGSVRLKYLAPQTATVAVFLRVEDGDFQAQAVRATANHGRQIKVYRTSDSIAFTLDEIAADVFVFINRPLEALNHSFVEELVAQALREECGLVTGISVEAEGRALLSKATEQLSVTRAVETISDEFFAVRREHLAAVGGLSSISSSQMPELIQKLVLNARERGMRVIVTPFAVATFHAAPGWNPFCAASK